MLISAARILLFCVLACLATGPLFGYLQARRDFGLAVRERLWVVAAYYLPTLTVAAAVVMLIAGFRFELTQRLLGRAFDPLLITGLFGLPLLGPWIGGAILAVAPEAGRNVCKRCGYSLIGNLSGVCPECGNAAAKDPPRQAPLRTRWRCGPWKRVAGIWLTGVALLLLAASVQSSTWYRFCTECACREHFRSYGLVIPFTTHRLWKTSDFPLPEEFPDKGMTAYLDPTGMCRHAWLGMGSDDETLFCSIRGSGPDWTYTAVVYEEDFAAFLAAHPEALDIFRTKLRQRVGAREAIYDLYRKWRQEQNEAGAPDENSTSNAERPTVGTAPSTPQSTEDADR